MRLVNGPAGYGTVTKVLHWLTVAAQAVQFTVGYAMEAVSEWVSGTDDSHADEAAVFVHGWIGGGILALAAHITAHVVFYVTLAVHVGLALRRRTLSRML